jgi:hypothetical protein
MEQAHDHAALLQVVEGETRMTGLPLSFRFTIRREIALRH